MLNLFANNASTTLASSITAGATTMTVATGTGAEFPNPTAGQQQFYMTLTDAATQIVREIVLCTSRTGDVCTIQRGQQGTSARAWGAGDLVAQLVTAGDLDAMVQGDELQKQIYVATDATGTNSITATLLSGLTALPNSLMIIMRAAAANTGAATLTLTLGSTVLSAHNIVKYGGSALNAGDIPAAGYPCILIWSATLGAYVMNNPASGTAGSIAGGVANDVLIQTAPGTTGFVPAPTIAGQVLAFVGGVITWVVAAVTSFNGRGGAVMPQAGDYNAAQVGAIPLSAFSSPNMALVNPGFAALPAGSADGAGITIQAGSRSISPNTTTAISFPKIFPLACIAVVASCNNQTAVVQIDTVGRTSFNARTAASFINWIAIGY